MVIDGEDAMSEQNPLEAVAQAARQQQKQEAQDGKVREPVAQDAGKDSPQAPWERNGESFDADKAARLIANLREENAQLKTDRSRYRGERDELLSRIGHDARSVEERIATVEKENAQLRDQVWHHRRQRALTLAGISDEFVDLVHGSTDEEVNASVQRLVALAASGAGGGVPAFSEPGESRVASVEATRNELWKKGLGF